MTSASSFLGGGSFRPKGPPVEITSGFGTFIPSADGMWYRFTATAAGGGGGTGDTINGGGGAGAGATLRGIIKIPIAGIAYVIPAGGAAGAAGGGLTLGRFVVPGGASGQSRASGGRGGNGGGPAPLPSADPRATAGTGYVSYVPEGITTGGAGGDSFAFGGSASGAAMPPGYPLSGLPSSQTGIVIASAADTQGAGGGSSEFGTGGAIAANDAVGNNATGYGGGGGGGGKAASGSRAGGTGTGGRLYLEPLGVW